ncbi:MAG: secretin N-terminal domain-containing protein [Pseudomonadota bacterium]
MSPPSPAAPPADLEGAPGRSFQFREAPLDLVLSQVLGDGFGASYVIAPDVNDRITLRLENVSSAQIAVNALNAALAQKGLAITGDATGYVLARIRRDDTAPDGRFDVIDDQDDTISSEAAVLVLRYANPDEVVRLARPLVPENVIRGTDPSRGLVLLRGTSTQIASAVDALRAFDVDWFEATSATFIELQAAQADDMKRELDMLLERTGGVEIVSLPRLRALMIFARTPGLLDRAQYLVGQLDRSRTDMIDSETLIYEARFVPAERLISVASSLFGSPQTAYAPTEGYDPNLPALPSSSIDQNSFRMTIDEGMNLVVAKGSTEELRRLAGLLERIDRPQAQVLIEATIVEVGLRDEFRLGVNWSGIADNLNLTFADNTSGEVASRFPGLSVAFTNTDIEAVVNALDSETEVQIVSSPRILALNNTTATIQVGDQVPIVVQSAIAITDPGAPIVNAVEYRDTGVILNVTPRVRAGQIIEIEISQEVSNVAESTAGSAGSPTISQRLLQSVLAVPNAATIALGGLISSNQSESETGVPILRDIPVAERLFSSTTDITRRTELVVLVRPQIVWSDEPDFGLSERLANALDRVRSSWGDVAR